MQTFAMKSHAAYVFDRPKTPPPTFRQTPAVRSILRSPRVQPKLAIGAVNDAAEREADHVANQVMRMPDLTAAGDAGPPPIGPWEGGIQRLCADCENEKEQGGTIQRRATDTGAPATAPPSVHQVLRSPGRPLDPVARAFMEPRFGQDFGDVRIHTGSRAAESARSIHALAYTSGHDVVFGAGQYAPETDAGRRVLAHELTHVVQQSAPAAGTTVVSRQTDPGTSGLVRRAPDPKAGRTLSYREATELNKCIKIMGEDNAGYCRETVLGEPPGPQLAPSVTTPFVIVLHNVGIVPNAKVVEAVVRQAFEPISLAAGRPLQIRRSAPGDVGLEFDGGGHETKPCGLLILGNEGGGDIFVGAHEDLRVCNGPQGHPSSPDYTSQLQRVFDPIEVEFAQFVGATAVHELAHLIAKLPHTTDRSNFMLSDGAIGGNLPKAMRTLATMRKHWSETKSFDAGQVALLQEAIRTGQISGGMTVSSPPMPPITPKGPKKP